MKTDLLLILADRLEHDVPEGQWNFGTWGEQKECGFVGCAIGWATQWPEFKGLRLEYGSGGMSWPVCEGVGFRGSLFASLPVAVFFEIPTEDASDLFANTGNLYRKRRYQDVTPADVAAAIRNYLGVVPAPVIEAKEKVTVR